MNDLRSYWVNRPSTPLYTKPDKLVKVCDVPFGAVVEALGEFDKSLARVRYTTSSILEGWMYYGDAEALRYTLPFNAVDLGDMQTPSQQDAAQYVIYLNGIQYNLCGELCICSIFNVGLKNFLTEWKAAPNTWFNRVFNGGKARTTGVADLINMAALYPCTLKGMKEAFWNDYHQEVRLTPRRMSAWTDAGWDIIIGVKIGTRFGELRGSGVGHWVVIKSVSPSGINRASVTLYNPFVNGYEQYSWNELITSIGSAPFGLLIRLPSPVNSVNLHGAGLQAPSGGVL